MVFGPSFAYTAECEKDGTILILPDLTQIGDGKVKI